MGKQKGKKSGKASTTPQFNVEEWRKSLLQRYLEPAAPEPEEMQQEEEAEDSVNDKSIKASVECETEGCKRKQGDGCCHRMCFQCCYEQPTSIDCAAHFKKRGQREEEERMLENMLNGSKKNCLRMPEEKLTETGQTVVVWCLVDFFRHKKWSEDVFSLYMKKKRQAELMKRRQAFRVAAEEEQPNVGKGRKKDVEDKMSNRVVAGIDISDRTVARICKQRRASMLRRKACYEKVTRKWEELSPMLSRISVVERFVSKR